ncbi:MAG: CBS domain-containing protein [Polyangiaceae bacterium]
MLKARDVMTHKVLCAEAVWTLDELVSFLAEHGISGAPVIDEKGAIVGIVSVTDVARQRIPERMPMSDSGDLLERAFDERIGPDELRGMSAFAPDGTTVREIMTPMVFDVTEDTPVAEVADLMIRGRIHRVVVMRRGRAVGIVSSLDLLRIVRDLGMRSPSQSPEAPTETQE